MPTDGHSTHDNSQGKDSFGRPGSDDGHEEHGGGHETPAAAITGMDHGGMDHDMGAPVRAPEDEADSLSLFGGLSLVVRR